MKKSAFLVVFLLLVSSFGFAQKRAKPRPRAAAKAAVKQSVDMGKVSGRTYINKTFGFEITFPDTWLIPDNDFEEYMKKQGFDLSLKAPDSLPASSKDTINKALQRVTILLTAYRSMPGSSDNAIVRVSVEDLKPNPQIKDAVDYFDAIRTTYKTMKLSTDFEYSETQAEKLGSMQFAYIDTLSSDGRKRMYATVRNGFAIMFTLSYSAPDDLDTFRQVLKDGNFALK